MLLVGVIDGDTYSGSLSITIYPCNVIRNPITITGIYNDGNCKLSAGDNFAFNTSKIAGMRTLQLTTVNSRQTALILAILAELYLENNFQIQQLVAMLNLPQLSYLMI